MLRVLLNPIFLIFLFIPIYLSAQTSKKTEGIDLFPYLDVLLSRAQSDISEEIINNKLNERVAITRFEVNGLDLEDKYRTLIIKSFEEIREENKFFHLVGSIEALNKTIIVENTLQNYTPEELIDLQNYSLDLNANYYAIINLSVIDKALVLTIIIHNAREHDIIWGKKWSTILREGTKSFNIGFYQGITIPGNLVDVNMFPFAIHLGVDWKIFNFVDLGYFLDPGANILYTDDPSQDILGANIQTGVKLAFDVINVFNVLYNNIEMPLYFRTGLGFSYYVSHPSSFIKNIPLIYFSVKPGFALIINRNYTIFAEYDIMGIGNQEKAIFSGFYYRFEF